MLGTGDAMYILNPEALMRTHMTRDTSTVALKEKKLKTKL
jgi:hypothetical protein